MKRNLTVWFVLAMLVLGMVPMAFAADDAKQPEAAPAAAPSAPAAATVPAVKMVAGGVTEIAGDKVTIDSHGTKMTLTVGENSSLRKGAETIKIDQLTVGDQILALVRGEGDVASLFVKTVPAAAATTPAAAPAAPAAEEKKGY